MNNSGNKRIYSVLSFCRNQIALWIWGYGWMFCWV